MFSHQIFDVYYEPRTGNLISHSAEAKGAAPSVAFRPRQFSKLLQKPDYLRHLHKILTNSDFFKRRYYQSSVPLSSGVVLKSAEATGIEPVRLLHPAVFKTVSSTYRTTSIYDFYLPPQLCYHYTTRIIKLAKARTWDSVPERYD